MVNPADFIRGGPGKTTTICHCQQPVSWVHDSLQSCKPGHFQTWVISFCLGRSQRAAHRGGGGSRIQPCRETLWEAQAARKTSKFKFRSSLGLGCCSVQGRTRLSNTADYSIGHAGKGGPSFWLQGSVFTLNAPVKLSQLAFLCN